jgi:hypothetical protein
LRQQGRHDAVSSGGVKSKIVCLPMETAIAAREKRRQTALNGENPFLPAKPWAATEK